MVRKFLLGYGIVSSVLYVASDILISWWDPNYSYRDQSFSGLLAPGSSTRSLLLVLNAIPYSVLVTAFGVGVWVSAGRRCAGRITGALLVGYAVIGAVGGCSSRRPRVRLWKRARRPQRHHLWPVGRSDECRHAALHAPCRGALSPSHRPERGSPSGDLGLDRPAGKSAIRRKAWRRGNPSGDRCGFGRSAASGPGGVEGRPRRESRPRTLGPRRGGKHDALAAGGRWGRLPRASDRSDRRQGR